MKIVLIGNPNCGKTTLFNTLTGSRLPVGNRAGVTVKETAVSLDGVKICDLPGIYSLFSPVGEEKDAAKALSDADVVFNLINATDLGRSLFLTLQLLSFCNEHDVKMMVILNIVERAKNQGIDVDENKLSGLLNCPVIKIYRRPPELKSLMIPSDPKGYLAVKREPNSIYSVADKIASVTINRKNNKRDKNPDIGNFSQSINNVKIKHKSKNNNFADVMEKLIFGKNTSFLAIIAMCVAALCLASGVSIACGELVKTLLNMLAVKLSVLTTGLNKGLAAFICDGLTSGIGSVLQFLPLVGFIFLVLEAAEDSGLLPRIAAVCDSYLSHLGLSGRSAISFFVGAGCTVPAVMNARTSSTTRERGKCIGCVHFVPCSAKIPLCALVLGAFGGTAQYFFPIIYLIAPVTIVAANLFTKRTDEDFIMEIPPLKTPDIRSVVRSTKTRTKSFLLRICSVVFLSSLAVWVFSHFDFGCRYCDIDESILSVVGDKIKYIFYPVGLYDWKMAVTIISGFAGKETAAGVLSVLSGGDAASLFSPMSATVFILFVLLSPPCAASLGAIRKEVGIKKFAVIFLRQLAFAYIVCSIINVGYLLCSIIF